MTLASLSLPVVALALFLGTAWLSAALLLLLWRRIVGRSGSLARHTPLVSLLPWLLGAALALAAVLPGDPHTGQVLACHCLESMPAWLHLCPVHPEEAALLVLPAMGVIGVLLPERLGAAVALAREPLGHGGGEQPRIVSLGAPLALLHGWLRPTLVVDQTLWAALTAPERAAVVAHERGHLRRRDPWVRVLLRATLAVAPREVGARALRAWLDHAEHAADTEAARVTGDATLVAQTLLRCARLGAPSPALALSWTGGALERRVQALLVREGALPGARADLGLRELSLASALGALALAATPWLHHQVEHLLNLPL